MIIRVGVSDLRQTAKVRRDSTREKDAQLLWEARRIILCSRLICLKCGV
jgi:hypothetical protein